MLVLHEAWRPHPLAWIHRAEARELASELGAVDLQVLLEEEISDLPSQPLLLRVSDPVMRRATRALSRAGISYLGPGADALERCYDKAEAAHIVATAGIDCPANPSSYPLVVKPRRGSDSIGVRVLRRGPLPSRYAGEPFLVQEQVRGLEMTVAVLHGRPGMPIRILLPEGTPYSFTRKYLWRPRREPLADASLSERVRQTALRIAELLQVDWAVRVDFIYEPRRGRLYFLECDAAPLIGAASVFAASLAASGMPRAEQLRLLVSR